MARDLQNKTVVITGGATGIGYEIADNMLKKNVKVVILLDINVEEGTEAVKTLTSKYGNNRAIFHKCDVTNDLDVIFKNILDSYKSVDILVNNAGVLCETNIRKTIDVNVRALMEWSIKFWEHMRIDKSGKGGTIVNVASLYGFKVAPYIPIYQGSKFAVMGFTRSLGHSDNFKKFGVRVVAICPGFTETKLFVNTQMSILETNEEMEAVLKEQEWQKVEEVGKAAIAIFEVADSGTAWLIEGGKPIAEVP